MNHHHVLQEGTLRDGLYIKSEPSPYSAKQLSLYLDRIGYYYGGTPRPKEHHFSDENFSIADYCGYFFPADLKSLERLIPLHLLAFPFENTAMHYTTGHEMDLDPQYLYRRLMDEGKGSYCLGHNSFFLNVLRGLGYRAYTVVGKVNVDQDLEPTEYPPQGHLLILVQPIPDSNVTYLVDVGFGMGPTRPILLTDSDKSVVIGASAFERFRIKRCMDPRSSLGIWDLHLKKEKEIIVITESHDLDWVLQVQHVDTTLNTPDDSSSTSDPWIPMYIFSETEFYENDVYKTSFLICFSPMHGKIFQHNVFAVKCFLLDAEADFIFEPDEIENELEVAKGDVSDREFGRAVLIGRKLGFMCRGEWEIGLIETEDERIGVLKDVFGIVVTEEEREYIRGLPSALL